MQGKACGVAVFDCLWGADLALRASTQHMPILHICTQLSPQFTHHMSNIQFWIFFFFGWLVFCCGWFFFKFIWDFKPLFLRPLKAICQVYCAIICFLPPELGIPYTLSCPVFKKKSQKPPPGSQHLFFKIFCEKRNSVGLDLKTMKNKRQLGCFILLIFSFHA